jgi:hypothetical protein
MKWFGWVGVLCGSWLNCSTAWAHAVACEIKTTPTTIEFVLFYDDDTPAIGAKVELRAVAGGFTLQGTTADNGSWSVARKDLPFHGDYEFFADTGDGHALKRKLTTGPDGEDSSLRSERSSPAERFGLALLGVAGLVGVGGIVAARQKHRHN